MKYVIKFATIMRAIMITEIAVPVQNRLKNANHQVIVLMFSEMENVIR